MRDLEAGVCRFVQRKTKRRTLLPVNIQKTVFASPCLFPKLKRSCSAFPSFQGLQTHKAHSTCQKGEALSHRNHISQVPEMPPWNSRPQLLCNMVTSSCHEGRLGTPSQDTRQLAETGIVEFCSLSGKGRTTEML